MDMTGPTENGTTTHAQRLAAIHAKASARVLAGSLRILDAKAKMTSDENRARHWIIQELERRFPAADAAVEAAFAAAAPDEDVDYVKVLLDAIGPEAGQ